MSDSDSELMRPAIFVEVTDDEFDPSVPPTSGQEYLRRVQIEAKQCASVVVSDIDPSVFTSKQTVKFYSNAGLHPAPHGYAPNSQWQNKQTAAFASIRLTVSTYKNHIQKEKIKPKRPLPDKSDVEAWCLLCFGRLQLPSVRVQARPLSSPCGSPQDAKSDAADVKMSEDPVKDSSEMNVLCNPQNCVAACGSTREHCSNSKHIDLGVGDPSSNGIPPLLSIVAHMDQSTLTTVLEYHLHWFQATGFTPRQGQWFYALLCCLEKPLEPETCALLRSLVRSCASLRATLENVADERLAPLNLIITLVTHYFDQRDLADSI